MYWLIIATFILVLLLYMLAIKPFKYWQEKNVPQKSPLEVIINFVSAFVRGKPFSEILCDFYNESIDKRYIGVYPFGMARLLLRDLELIRQITVKEFDHFVDHRTTVPDSEPLWNSNLLSLKGDKWRQMRATLSPSFTSSKMKAMFVLMTQCAEDFLQFFLNNNSKVIDVDLSDILTRYTNDVIATTAFGIKCDSLKDRENDFYMMGKRVTGSFKGTLATIKFLLFISAPKIAKFFRLRMFNKNIGLFFINLVKDTIQLRKEKHIVRPDMIHLLMEARKGKCKENEINLPDTGFATVEEHIEVNAFEATTKLTDTDITAQALIFFLAGFQAVAITMCFIIHEIAIHPDVQERLLREVDDTFAACDGKLTYVALAKMKYLDMVVSEGLRLWPIAVMLDRECVKPFTMEPVNPDELATTISVGDVCWIPVFAIHHDPQYYSDPERFDPERFNDENKSNIKPFTYMPFGVGPRNCIGSRFALLEIKVLLFHILTQFEFVPTEKTEIPLKFTKTEINLAPDNGFHLGFKRRANK